MPQRGDKQQRESGPRVRAGKAPPVGGTTSAGGGRQQVEAVSDPLVLAAVARAYRHRSAEGLGVPIWHILERLAIAKRTKAAREVRARLDAMHADGLVQSSRRHGVVVWALTLAGKRRLERELRSLALHICPSLHSIVRGAPRRISPGMRSSACATRCGLPSKTPSTWLALIRPRTRTPGLS